jgi:hypothetical protein
MHRVVMTLLALTSALCVGTALAQDVIFTPGGPPPPSCSICTSIALYKGAQAYLDDPHQLPTVTQYPDPFVMLNGTKITTQSQWNQRRTELQSLEEFYLYGHAPPSASVSIVSQQQDQVIGSMIYRYFNLRVNTPGGPLPFFVDLYIPNTGGPFANGVPGNGPYPVILSGEASWDPIITPFSDGNEDASVGQANLETLVSRGYIVAEFGRDNFSEDSADVGTAFSQSGVFPLYPYDPKGTNGYDWGVIAAWAWGYSRAIDFLETMPYVDSGKIIAIGHSRGGLTTQVAASLDTRIAMAVVSQGMEADLRSINNPTNIGEADISYNINYAGIPGWYGRNTVPFSTAINNFPLDCPSLLGLIAPRALLITAATSAQHENPESDTNCFRALQQVWGAFGATNKVGLFTGNTNHQMSMGYWSAALDFADQILFKHSNRSPSANAISVPVSPTDYSSTPYTNLTMTKNWTIPNLQ